MSYQLFTFPNCSVCSDVKEYLKSRNVEYKEFNIGLSEVRKGAWAAIYKKLTSPLKKGNDDSPLMPIFVETRESGEIERILQGEDIKNIFN